jgi:acetyl-CoA C-acetyltransferase
MTSWQQASPNIPVIIGIGEAVSRKDEPPVEPLALLEKVVRQANADAGVPLKEAATFRMVHVMSWSYADLPQKLASRLGLRLESGNYGMIGGETPISQLIAAGEDIAEGRAKLVVVCGAESFLSLKKAGDPVVDLNWSTPEKPAAIPRLRDMQSPEAVRHGLDKPLLLYPLYENARISAAGVAPAAARLESADICAAMSRTAANNPCAWDRQAYQPEEILRSGKGNREVVWPYTKKMVAQPTVDQAAALILTSYAHARELGVPEHKIIALSSAAYAEDTNDMFARNQFVESDAMRHVLENVLSLSSASAAGCQLHEIYSCFPCVPKMAREILGLPPSDPMTVTGGLPFFGAPLSNYMSHAAVAMVRQMRERPASAGLLYGQGGILTKHAGLVLTSSGPGGMPKASAFRRAPDWKADEQGGQAPRIVSDYSGKAELETFTVEFDRDGAPGKGIVVLRTPSGERAFGHVLSDDESTLALLMNPETSPIGLVGKLTAGSGSVAIWSAA